MSTETISKIVAFWLGSSLENPEAAFSRKDWWYKGGGPVGLIFVVLMTIIPCFMNPLFYLAISPV